MITPDPAPARPAPWPSGRPAATPTTAGPATSATDTTACEYASRASRSAGSADPVPDPAPVGPGAASGPSVSSAPRRPSSITTVPPRRPVPLRRGRGVPGFLHSPRRLAAVVEHLPHAPQEGVRREGLLEEGGARIEDAVMDDGRAGVPRDVEHLQARPERTQTLGELAPAQSRHHYVRHEQVDRARRPFEHPRRLAGVGHGQHGVAVHLEHLAGELADRLVVLDQQHRLRAPAEHDGLGLRPADLAGRVDPRQVDLDGRTPPDLAIRGDVAAALLDDPVDGREAEARPLADALGREERLKEVD